MLKNLDKLLALSLAFLAFSHNDLCAQVSLGNCVPNLAFEKTAWQIDHDLFAIHAIPKCGTHFIQRTIHLMTNQTIINRNVMIPKLAEACQHNQILRTFQPYHPDLMNILKNTGHKLIAMVRDPRDALVSHAFYMRTFADRPGDKTRRDFFVVGTNYDQLTFEQQIDSLISGSEHSPSYLDFYLERTGWAKNRESLTIRYEDLVGDAGGGNDEIKKAVVQQIINFIHLDISEEKLQYVLDNMYVNFGENTLEDKVFERSSIGNWRKFLSRDQIRLIKKKIGKEIIQLGYEKDYHW